MIIDNNCPWKCNFFDVFCHQIFIHLNKKGLQDERKLFDISMKNAQVTKIKDIYIPKYKSYGNKMF